MSESIATLDTEGIRWVPVRTASLALKVTKQRVYALIKEGALASREIDGVRLVSLKSLNDRIAAMSAQRGGRHVIR